VRVLIVEDEPYMAEAIRDGLRLEAIAADVAGDGGTTLELLSINAYDIAVLDRDIPGPSGDEIAKRIVASGSGMPILMLTAADRLADKASGVTHLPPTSVAPHPPRPPVDGICDLQASIADCNCGDLDAPAPEIWTARPEKVGSGKFGTPWARMHWAQLSHACCWLGESC
jgi:CheY-like chemotaxis protein